MDPDDVVTMQRQFAKHMSEFSARTVSAWADAVKRMGFPSPRHDIPEHCAGRIDVSPWMGMTGSPSAIERLQESMTLAAQDLPILATCPGDESRLAQIRSRWAKACERSVRQLLGLPSPSHMERLLEQWSWALEWLSPDQPRLPGLEVSRFLGLVSPSGWPLPRVQDGPRELLRAWEDSYGKMFGMDLAISAEHPNKDHQEGMRKAVEAQVRFLRSLPELHAHIAAVSIKTVAKILSYLQEPGSMDAPSEMHRLFSTSWVAATEQMYQELFGSEAFMHVLSKTVHQGLEAREKLQSMMSDRPSARNDAMAQEAENLGYKLYTLEKRVLLLERELEDLKRELAKPPLQDTALTGHEG